VQHRLTISATAAVIIAVFILFILISVRARADDAPAPAAIPTTPTAPKAAPVCTWPADGLDIKLSLYQAQIVQAWATGQDYSHAGWQSLAPSLLPQLTALQAKYCK
jgi:hypothetical protein